MGDVVQEIVSTLGKAAVTPFALISDFAGRRTPGSPGSAMEQLWNPKPVPPAAPTAPGPEPGPPTFYEVESLHVHSLRDAYAAVSNPKVSVSIQGYAVAIGDAASLLASQRPSSEEWHTRALSFTQQAADRLAQASSARDPQLRIRLAGESRVLSERALAAEAEAAQETSIGYGDVF